MLDNERTIDHVGAGPIPFPASEPVLSIIIHSGATGPPVLLRADFAINLESRASFPSAVSPLPHIFPYVHAPAHASRPLRIVLDAAGARAGTYEERGGRTSARVVGVGTATEHEVLSHQ